MTCGCNRRGSALHNRGKGRENLRAVAIIDDDVLVGVGRTQDSIDGIGKLNAKRTGHEAEVDHPQCTIPRPDPVSFQTLPVIAEPSLWAAIGSGADSRAHGAQVEILMPAQNAGFGELRVWRCRRAYVALAL